MMHRGTFKPSLYVAKEQLPFFKPVTYVQQLAGVIYYLYRVVVQIRERFLVEAFFLIVPSQ
jgi:hypothetical protein